MGLAGALAAFLLLANVSMTFAAEVVRVAQVEKLTGQVSILRAGVHVPIKVADPLFEKDVVETGADGGIGITFIDNTVFSAGPNSEIRLEEFRFNSNNFQGAMLADMRRGTILTAGMISTQLVLPPKVPRTENGSLLSKKASIAAPVSSVCPRGE
jgi:hypothetical protein